MDKNKKDQIIITIVCTILSIGLWIYITNVENKTRSTDINKIPVEIINQESLKNINLALSPNQEFFVNLKIEGNTSDINKIKKSDFKIQVDLEEYVWKKGDNKVPVSIIDYPISISIKNTNTLTASIKIEQLKEKTISIESQIQVMPVEGYFLSETKLSETKIKISGAESLIEKVDKVVIRDSISNADENITGTYEPIAIDNEGNVIEGIEFSLKEVKVDLLINKGKSTKLIYETVGNVKEGIRIRSIELERNLVEIIGPSEILEKIKEIKTSPLDLSTINEDKEVFLAVLPEEGTTIKSGEEYVKAIIKVEKTIEKNFNIQYSTTGLNEGLKVIPDKESISVTLTGFEDEINKIKEENLRATLNLSEYKEEGAFEKYPEINLEGIASEFTVKNVEIIKFTISKLEPEVQTGAEVEVQSDNN